MKAMLKGFLALAGLTLAMGAGAQVTFYSGEGFHGQSLFVDRPMHNLDRTGFNDRASSAVVQNGRWQACEDANFQGRCVILRPGEYPALDRIGMGRNISSIRPVEQYGRAEEWQSRPYERRYEYDYYRR
jgi:hypothetical protein